jgi:hypothetical protein
MDQPEQDVLGADVIVVEESGFFLRENNNPSGPVGKPLKQGPLLIFFVRSGLPEGLLGSRTWPVRSPSVFDYMEGQPLPLGTGN